MADIKYITLALKILVICGAGYVSGLEVVTLSLIEGLRKQGHNVKCITTTWGDGDFASRLKDRQVPYIRLPLGFISKTLSWSALVMTLDQIRKLPQLWIGYHRYTRNFRPDIIIHSNFQHIFLLWLMMGRDCNVYHVHNSFPSTRFYRILFRFLSLKLSRFIGVSKFVADCIVRLGIPESKASFVHNGAEVRASVATGLKTYSDSTYEIDRSTKSDSIKIGIVGQIGDWKGHDDLFDALYLLKAQSSRFICLVYGRGDYKYIQSLKEKLDKYELAEYVQWVGFVKDPEKIFSTLDVCVIPSRFAEPFGMVAIEAASFGVPVISTRQGGLPEIICNERTGFLVDANSPKQIADKLSLLIQDKSLREKLGSTARKHFQENFSQIEMIEKMEAIFLKATRISNGK